MLGKKLKKEKYKKEIHDKLINNSDKGLYKACCLPDNQFYGIIKYIYKANYKGRKKYKKEDLRTYDVSILYDYYYKMPRIYFTGYNYIVKPLTYKEIKEDIFIENLSTIT